MARHDFDFDIGRAARLKAGLAVFAITAALCAASVLAGVGLALVFLRAGV